MFTEYLLTFSWKMEMWLPESLSRLRWIGCIEIWQGIPTIRSAHTNSLKRSEVIKHPPVFGMEHHAVSGPSGQNGPCQGWAARGSRHGDRKAWEAMSQNWSLTLKRGTCKHQQYPLVLKHGWGNTEIYSWANHLQMEKSQASHVSLPAVGKWLISIYHHESYPKYS